jgi:hypothetical protein
MIRFELTCGQAHAFEGWFRDGASFEQQAAAGALACPLCGEHTVRKAVMAPAIARGRNAPAPADPRKAAMAKALVMMRQVQAHIEQSYDNVGERFPEEARRIHYGEVERRDIYGQASDDEAQALRDEGIPVSRFPALPKLDG